MARIFFDKKKKKGCHALAWLVLLLVWLIVSLSANPGPLRPASLPGFRLPVSRRHCRLPSDFCGVNRTMPGCFIRARINAAVLPFADRISLLSVYQIFQTENKKNSGGRVPHARNLAY